MKNNKIMVVYNGTEVPFRNKIFLVPENFRTQNFTNILGKEIETKFLQIFRTSDTVLIAEVQKQGLLSFDENMEHPDFKEHENMMVKYKSPKIMLKNRVVTIKKLYLNGDVLLSDGVRINSFDVEKFDVKLKNYALECIKEKGYYTNNASNNLVEFYFVYGKNNSFKFTSKENYEKSWRKEYSEHTKAIPFDVEIVTLCQGAFPDGTLLLTNNKRVNAGDFPIFKHLNLLDRKKAVREIKEKGYFCFDRTQTNITIKMDAGTGKGKTVTAIKDIAGGVYGVFKGEGFKLTEGEQKIVADSVGRVKQYTKEDLEKVLAENPTNIDLIKEIVGSFGWKEITPDTVNLNKKLNEFGVDIPAMLLQKASQEIAIGGINAKYRFFPKFVVIKVEPYTDHVFRIVDEVLEKDQEPRYILNNGLILPENYFKDFTHSDIKNVKLASQFTKDDVSLHALAMEEICKNGYFYIGKKSDLSIRETMLNEIFIQHGDVREWYSNNKEAYFILADRILIPNENYASVKWGVEGTEHQHGFIEYGNFDSLSLFPDSETGGTLINIKIIGGGVYRLKFKKGDKAKANSFLEKLKAVSNKKKKSIFIEQEIENLTQQGYEKIASNGRDYVFISNNGLMFLNSDNREYFHSMLVDTIYRVNDNHIEFFDNSNNNRFFFDLNLMPIDNKKSLEETFTNTKAKAVKNKMDKKRKELLYKENKIEKVFECVDDTLFVVSDGILFLNTTEKLSFSDIGGVFCAVNGEFNNSLIIGVGKNVLEIETKATDEQTQEFTEYLLLKIEKYLENEGLLKKEPKNVLFDKYENEVNRLDLNDNKTLILTSDLLVVKDNFTGEIINEQKVSDLIYWTCDDNSKVLEISFKNDKWFINTKNNDNTKRSNFFKDFSELNIDKNRLRLLDKFKEEKNIWGSFELTSDIILYNKDAIYFHGKSYRTSPKLNKLHYFEFNLGDLVSLDMIDNILMGGKILMFKFNTQTVEINVDKNIIADELERFIQGLACNYNLFCNENNLTEQQKLSQISLAHDVKISYDFVEDVILMSDKEIIFFDTKVNLEKPRELIYEIFEFSKLRYCKLEKTNEVFYLVFCFNQNNIIVKTDKNKFNDAFYQKFLQDVTNGVNRNTINVSNQKLKVDFLVAVDNYKKNNPVVDSLELENGVLLVSESYATSIIISEKTDSVDKATYYFNVSHFFNKDGDIQNNQKYPVILYAETNSKNSEIGRIGADDCIKLKDYYLKFVENKNLKAFQEGKNYALKHELGCVENFIVDARMKNSNIVLSDEKIIVFNSNVRKKDYKFDYAVFKRELIFNAKLENKTINLFFNNFAVVLYFDTEKQARDFLVQYENPIN